MHNVWIDRIELGMNIYIYIGGVLGITRTYSGKEQSSCGFFKFLNIYFLNFKIFWKFLKVYLQ